MVCNSMVGLAWDCRTEVHFNSTSKLAAVNSIRAVEFSPAVNLSVLVFLHQSFLLNMFAVVIKLLHAVRI